MAKKNIFGHTIVKERLQVGPFFMTYCQELNKYDNSSEWGWLLVMFISWLKNPSRVVSFAPVLLYISWLKCKKCEQRYVNKENTTVVLHWNFTIISLLNWPWFILCSMLYIITFNTIFIKREIHHYMAKLSRNRQRADQPHRKPGVKV